MIIVSHIYKRFEENHVLIDATISFEENKVYAILAPNGAGKTTFISILSGLMKQDSGEIEYTNGIKKEDFNVILSGERNLYMKNTVYENIKYLCALKGMDTKSVNKQIELEQNNFPLYETIKNKLVESLSFGQKRLVALMSAIVSGAKYIIIDEATEGLDVVNREILCSAIRKAATGKIIIIIAHDLIFAQQTADKIAFLREGKFTEIMDRDEQANIEDVYKKIFGGN